MPPARQIYRYLTALPSGKGSLLLAWRLLPTDRPDAPFYVERRRGAGDRWQRANAAPILDATCLLDRTPEVTTYEYRVCSGDGTHSETIRIDSGTPPSPVSLDVPLDPADVVGGIALGEIENEGRIGYALRVSRGNTVWFAAYGHKGTAFISHRQTR